MKTKDRPSYRLGVRSAAKLSATSYRFRPRSQLEPEAFARFLKEELRQRVWSPALTTAGKNRVGDVDIFDLCVSR